MHEMKTGDFKQIRGKKDELFVKYNISRVRVSRKIKANSKNEDNENTLTPAGC